MRFFFFLPFAGALPRAMAKRPENRYKSAAEMLEALNAYVENPAIVFNYTYLLHILTSFAFCSTQKKAVK